MARPRSFDLDTVLDRAMQVFWRRGYAETSMADIYDATGLKPGSLYGAVRNKDELFRQVFERYVARFRGTLPQGLDGLPAIEAWLATQVRLAAEDPERRGCLIINTTLERDSHPEATRALARGRLAEIRAFFDRHLRTGQARGELDPDLRPEAIADALLGSVIAIMSLARAGADTDTLRHVAEAATAALRPRRISSGTARP